MNKHEEIDFIYFNFISYVLSVYARGRHLRLYGCQTTCRQKSGSIACADDIGGKGRANGYGYRIGYYDFGAWLADLEPEECNQLQKLSEQTRLKIPYLIGMDAAHGYAMLTGRTIFPTSISMAATFNRELIYRTTSKAGEEIRSSGIHWAFAPCIDIVQDARWGRTGETYGEDPFLTSELVKEAIRGYQDNENPFKKVAVLVKHLVGCICRRM